MDILDNLHILRTEFCFLGNVTLIIKLTYEGQQDKIVSELLGRVQLGVRSSEWATYDSTL